MDEDTREMLKLVIEIAGLGDSEMSKDLKRKVLEIKLKQVRGKAMPCVGIEIGVALVKVLQVALGGDGTPRGEIVKEFGEEVAKAVDDAGAENWCLQAALIMIIQSGKSVKWIEEQFLGGRTIEDYQKIHAKANRAERHKHKIIIEGHGNPEGN